ncbi:hypothetical protein K0M31_004929 [Melipona bicolor]|uniref:Uncharacterized protein n=1 Tax=Melipona bicolor TaxID=60889 RepID=A0AA40FW19_9HYME|nr:hypothetical protein K0M31_004929 [Melipona bicolor]
MPYDSRQLVQIWLIGTPLYSDTVFALARNSLRAVKPRRRIKLHRKNRGTSSREREKKSGTGEEERSVFWRAPQQLLKNKRRRRNALMSEGWVQRSEGNEAEFFLAVSGTPLFPKEVERERKTRKRRAGWLTQRGTQRNLMKQTETGVNG